MLSKNVLYYGREEATPEEIDLRAGPLSLVFEPGAGFLRYIRMGAQEILRGIYVAVRDQNWGTIPPQLSNLKVETSEDTFRLTFDVECQEGEIDFFWHGAITGDKNGSITFTMDGAARSTFLRNRIGFCVLHPIRECAGQPCIVEKVDDTIERGVFPYYISPHQPFIDMRAISHEVIPGCSAEVRFEGDIFEMEDQRNWTDASFKTYCTPLELPFPVEVKEGTTISQSVTLTLKGEIPSTTPKIHPGTPEVNLIVDDKNSALLPRLGLGMASHSQPLSDNELERLKALNLSHLRVDLKLFKPNYVDMLKKAAVEADVLGVSLEAALFLTDAAENELRAFAKEIQKIKPRVSAWLPFHTAEKSTTERWIRLARRYLANYNPEMKIGSGTNIYFTELNRERPPVDVLGLVCYSLNPQVHAFDNASLVETLEGQAETVKSARQFIGDLPLAITPVTFKPRFNPNATDSEPESNPEELPSQVDVRQMSLFGAAWTLGSLKNLAESGVYSVTYYETSGWRGVQKATNDFVLWIETEQGSPLPEKFRSLPGPVFPLYHVFADVGEFAGGAVVPIKSSDPLIVDGLAVCKDGKIRLILANFASQPQQITIRNLNANIQVKHLDETNAEYAMFSPEEFRTNLGETIVTHNGAVKLDLLPYAVVRIDT